MDYQQALDLQIWCYSNLDLNICLKEEIGGRWQVVLGLPAPRLPRAPRGPGSPLVQGRSVLRTG